MEGVCKWCGALWSEHDREQLARECFPKQIEQLRSALIVARAWMPVSPAYTKDAQADVDLVDNVIDQFKSR